MADKWYSDSDVKSSFMEVLIDAGVLDDTDAVKSYNAKPFRFNAAYAAWEEAEFPDSTSDDWDEFVDAITDDSDDEEEEEEEEEEEDSEEG